ncbi:MAG: AmmeMemoRadiSam system protein A, partial [Planctomycetota bacterium]
AGAERSPRLEQRRGAFVTLKREGALRGCLGSVVGTEPLWRSIVRLAVAAATQDPRFAPVTADELERLSEEISVLTPPRPIAPEEIEVGRHGLIVQRGPYSGLLLPQVATEHGLDREQFLEHTCLKAGLDRGAWRRAGTGILGFEAQVFGPERLVELL